MKVRLKFNRKIILGVSALLCCIAIVALCSFFPFIIDPSRWQTAEFLSDELIVTAIVIFSLVCVMFVAQASNAQNPDSRIARARVRFLGGSKRNADGTYSRTEGSVERITKHDRISSFSQWVKQVFQPRDVRSAKERMLSKAGIEDFSILNLEEAEIRALIGTPQKYGDRFYKGITKKQAVEALRAKRLRIDLVDPSYYLTCSSLGNNMTITEKSGSETKKKTALLSFSIISKVAVGVVIAMIFASLVYDTSTGVEQAKAWMKFASRMFSMATSAFMGYLVGCQVNDIDADFVEMKCLVHDEFFEDSTFVPLSQQELAKKAYVERVREENSNLLPSPQRTKEDEKKE